MGLKLNLPKMAANMLAKMAGYYTLLLHGWDGKRNPEIEARERVLRGFLRDSMMLQRGAGEADTLKEKIDERHQQWEESWGGPEGVRGLAEMLAEKWRQQHNPGSAGDGDSEAGNAEEPAAGTEDELPQENTKERERMEVESSVLGSEQSGLVKAGQSESHLAVESDEREETGAGAEVELPQENTKEHDRMEGENAFTNREESGLVKAGQTESHLMEALENGEDLPQRSAGNGKE